MREAQLRAGIGLTAEVGPRSDLFKRLLGRAND
jgi:hypothetical protein